MKYDYSSKNPRGLSPKDRKRWNELCKELLFLYELMPMGNTSRKAIAGYKEGIEGINSWIMFFRGDEADVVRLRDALGEMK